MAARRRHRLNRIPIARGSVRDFRLSTFLHPFDCEAPEEAPLPQPQTKRRVWRSPEGIPALVRAEQGINSLADLATASSDGRAHVSREDLLSLQSDLALGVLDAAPWDLSAQRMVDATMGPERPHLAVQSGGDAQQAVAA